MRSPLRYSGGCCGCSTTGIWPVIALADKADARHIPHEEGEKMNNDVLSHMNRGEKNLDRLKREAHKEHLLTSWFYRWLCRIFDCERSLSD